MAAQTHSVIVNRNLNSKKTSYDPRSYSRNGRFWPNVCMAHCLTRERGVCLGSVHCTLSMQRIYYYWTEIYDAWQHHTHRHSRIQKHGIKGDPHSCLQMFGFVSLDRKKTRGTTSILECTTKIFSMSIFDKFTLISFILRVYVSFFSILFVCSFWHTLHIKCPHRTCMTLDENADFLEWEEKPMKFLLHWIDMSWMAGVCPFDVCVCVHLTRAVDALKHRTIHTMRMKWEVNSFCPGFHMTKHVCLAIDLCGISRFKSMHTSLTFKLKQTKSTEIPNIYDWNDCIEKFINSSSSSFGSVHSKWAHWKFPWAREINWSSVKNQNFSIVLLSAKWQFRMALFDVRNLNWPNDRITIFALRRTEATEGGIEWFDLFIIPIDCVHSWIVVDECIISMLNCHIASSLSFHFCF